MATLQVAWPSLVVLHVVHLFIGGEPGAGTSVTLNLIVAHAAPYTTKSTDPGYTIGYSTSRSPWLSWADSPSALLTRVELAELLLSADARWNVQKAQEGVDFADSTEPVAAPVTSVDEKRSRARQLSRAESARLVKAYCAGATVYQLAAEFDVHRVTIGKLLRRQGVRLRLDGLNDSELAEAITIYRQGLPLAKVAKRFGVDPSTVCRQFKAHGVRTRDSHGRER